MVLQVLNFDMTDDCQLSCWRFIRPNGANVYNAVEFYIDKVSPGHQMATCMKTFGVYLCTQLKRWLRKNKMLAGVLWELRMSYIGTSKRWWLWHDVP